MLLNWLQVTIRQDLGCLRYLASCAWLESDGARMMISAVSADRRSRAQPVSPGELFHLLPDAATKDVTIAVKQLSRTKRIFVIPSEKVKVW